MANTTFDFAKAISLVDYLPAFTVASEQQSWDWNKVTDVKSTTSATEQVFSWNRLPISASTGELEPVNYASLSENAATTFTVNKYTLGSMFSYEMLEDNRNLPDLMKEAGAALGDSQRFLVDTVVAQIFNRAFNSAYPVWDGVELCGTHTLLDNSTTIVNDAAVDLSWDTVWDAMVHFEKNLLTQQNLYIRDTPTALIYHPSDEKIVRKIFRATNEPDTPAGYVNPQTLDKVQLIPNRYLTDSDSWFLVGGKFKADNCFFWRDKPKVEMEDDFDRMGMKIRSHQRFAHGVRDFTYIYGSTGA